MPHPQPGDSALPLVERALRIASTAHHHQRRKGGDVPYFAHSAAVALILARFVPIVRTFVTLVAGVGKMDFRKFITYTAIGGVLWACGVTIAGFYLGNIPIIKHNIEAVLILIVFVSVIPMLVEFMLHRRRARKMTSAA